MDGSHTVQASLCACTELDTLLIIAFGKIAFGQSFLQSLLFTQRGATVCL
jgi:hypothetical protein